MSAADSAAEWVVVMVAVLAADSVVVSVAE